MAYEWGDDPNYLLSGVILQALLVYFSKIDARTSATPPMWPEGKVSKPHFSFGQVQSCCHIFFHLEIFEEMIQFFHHHWDVHGT